jgi:hypothetical protein
MISALHLMFVAVSQDQLIDAVSLSVVCDPDVFDGKDCFQLGLQILGALYDASSGTLRDIIQQLFRSGQITRFSTLFSSMKKSFARLFADIKKRAPPKFRDKIAVAKATADEAKGTADETKKTANQAKGSADQAKETADEAKGINSVLYRSTARNTLGPLPLSRQGRVGHSRD